ncbi:hypothetical protein CRG98_008938 [Punica granatum]|uniref:Uncharacterized protein n=1 Tax=Punica granatum TaxID=22663 RepID=A0A2I0KQD7_PUNGR|nr:hypothetical protein CRG98_008938 [Punica granatum]
MGVGPKPSPFSLSPAVSSPALPPLSPFFSGSPFSPSREIECPNPNTSPVPSFSAQAHISGSEFLSDFRAISGSKFQSDFRFRSFDFRLPSFSLSFTASVFCNTAVEILILLFRLIWN